MSLFMNEDIEEEIWRLHMSGLAPSQISKILKIPEDKARKEVSDRWYMDKMRHLRMEGKWN